MKSKVNPENPLFIKLKDIWEESLQNIEVAVDSITDPELKTKNKAELTKIQEQKESVLDILLNIVEEKRFKTATGKIYYSELYNRTVRINRNSKQILDFPKTWVEIDDFYDYIELTYQKVKKIPYRDVGITIVGFGLIVIPFYNILTLAIGGYLLYSSDYKGKIAGLSMIIGLVIFLLFLRVIFQY